MLAVVAIALRFVPYSDHDYNHYRIGWSIVMGLILLAALAASVYLVYVLEIFKFKGLRTIQLRRLDPNTTEPEIDEAVQRDVETGEFEAVKATEPELDKPLQRDVETGEFEAVKQ